MILNIHGYNHDHSADPGKNSVFNWLRHTYDDDIIALNIDYDNENPYSILEKLKFRIISYNQDVSIVGNSLGGFFGYALNMIFPAIPTVLFNPSLTPFLTLTGTIKRSILSKYVSMFNEIIYEGLDPETNFNNLHIFLSTEDSRIDHEKLTMPVIYPHSVDIISISQEHRVVIDENISNMIINKEMIMSSLCLMNQNI
jgi:predicted esterase YcpF (UPF0227 family)